MRLQCGRDISDSSRHHSATNNDGWRNQTIAGIHVKCHLRVFFCFDAGVQDRDFKWRGIEWRDVSDPSLFSLLLLFLLTSVDFQGTTHVAGVRADTYIITIATNRVIRER